MTISLDVESTGFTVASTVEQLAVEKGNNGADNRMKMRTTRGKH
jgi:hypothetical protein